MEKPEECEACGFITEKLTFYELFRRDDGHWLCEVCESTVSGNVHEYPTMYKNTEIIKMIAWCVNFIVKEIRMLKQ